MDLRGYDTLFETDTLKGTVPIRVGQSLQIYLDAKERQRQRCNWAVVKLNNREFGPIGLGLTWHEAGGLEGVGGRTEVYSVFNPAGTASLRIARRMISLTAEKLHRRKVAVHRRTEG